MGSYSDPDADDWPDWPACESNWPGWFVWLILFLVALLTICWWRRCGRRHRGKDIPEFRPQQAKKE